MSIQRILQAFNSTGYSLPNFLAALLTSQDYQTYGFATSVAGATDEILDMLISCQSTAEKVSQRAHKTAERNYQSQVQLLSQKGSGFHFLVRKVTEDQMKGFNIEHAALEMKRIAPDLWNLLGILLSADQHVKYQRKWSQRKAEAERGTRKRMVDQESMEIELGDEEFDVMSQHSEGKSSVGIDEHGEFEMINENEDEPENSEE